MKHSYFIFLFLFSGIVLTNLNAQSWDQFGSLTNFFDTEQNDFFNTELGNTQGDFRFGNFNLEGVVDSLFDQIDNNPLDNADGFDDFWDQDNSALFLTNGFNNTGSADSMTISNEYDNINNIWNTEMDSLNEGIGSYQDELNEVDLNALNQGEIRADFMKGTSSFSMNSIDRRFEEFIKENESQSVEDLDEILNSDLFSGLFDLEIAYGQESSDIRFWGDEYSVRANLIRVASVPAFRSTLETSWAIEASFFNKTDNIQQETNVALKDGLNTLMYHGNFSLLFLPHVGFVNGGKTEFRIYTSIGLDVGSYVPSHMDNDYPERVGVTTGFGPEIGLGFVVNFESISLYGYGTMAQGAIEEADFYNYNTSTLNTGIRIGDLLHIRYTLGESSWATKNHKTANFSRFTVGILLDTLRRD